jgi:ABC-type oligopeptide transport system ATPase subunit
MQTRSDLPETLEGDSLSMQPLRRAWRRLNVNNEHWMHVIVGREGIGKSLTGAKLCRLVDPSFDIGQVIFEPQRLLRILRDEEYTEGEMYLLDEAGVGLGKRTWHDAGQVKLNQALQLIRSHNIGVIFTLPRLSELDSQAQGRLHSYLELGTKEPGEYVRGRWRWLDPDRVDITDEIYREKPTYDGRDIDTVAYTPPDDEDLVETYEERKEQFQKQFYDEALGELEDNAEEETKPTDVAEAIRSNGGLEEYTNEINGGTQIVLDSDLIAADYGIGAQKSQRVKKLLMRDSDRSDLL